jgi:hypothetical protein
MIQPHQKIQNMKPLGKLPHLAAAVAITTTSLHAAAVSMDLSLQDWNGTSQSNYPGQAAFLTTAGLEAAYVWSGGAGAWERVEFNSSGAVFGVGNAGYEGRNTIRTIDKTYASVSFDAYITVANTGTNFEAWLGLGSGGVVSWNGPSAPADNAAFLRLRSGQDPWSPVGDINNHYAAVKVGPTVSTDQTVWGDFGPTAEIRMKLSYDAVAQTAVFSFDNNYNGTFSADHTLNPIDTSDLFGSTDDAVFFGSRSGGTLKDFQIQVVPEPGVSLLAALSGCLLLRSRRRVS